MWSQVTPSTVSTRPSGLVVVNDLTGAANPKNPYQGLHRAQGGESESPLVRQIAEHTADLQDLSLSGTVIIRRALLDGGDPVNAARLGQWFRQNVEVGDVGLLLTDDNRFLAEMERTGLTDLGNLNEIGGLVDGNYKNLKARDSVLAHHFAQHCEALPKLIQCPEGGLIVEVGAGRDWDRIAFLEQYAASLRGQFICHDVVPEAVRDAERSGVTTPYISLPPHSQFLGAALRGVEAPVVLTMKNVLSSLSCERLSDLFVTAELANAKRIVMTQTVTMATRLHPLPREFSAISPPLMELLGQRWDEAHAPLDAELMKIAKFHAINTYVSATMELMTRYAEHLARSHFGYRDFARVIEQRSSVLEPPAARAYLQVNFPDDMHMYSSGRCNTFIGSPFGGFFSYDARIAPGNLKIELMMFHLIADREGTAYAKADPAFRYVPRDLPLTPQSMVRSPDVTYDPLKVGNERTNPQRAADLGAAVAIMLLTENPKLSGTPLLSASADPRVKQHLIDTFHRCLREPAAFPTF